MAGARWRARTSSSQGRRRTTQDATERAWQANYAARQRYFEAAVGPLPADIVKMLNMTGVWPGGGLFEIPAPRLGPQLPLYTTFGLSNLDMPTTIRMADFELQSDGARPTDARGRLERKEAARAPSGAAGYGYEMVVVAESGQAWPLGFLQWTATAEIAQDIGLLGRVERYDGMTVQEINVGSGVSVNVLISKARAPLPMGVALPAGNMCVLAAVTITAGEMQWSIENGREALLQRLISAGVGQVSVLDRPSVVPL